MPVTTSHWLTATTVGASLSKPNTSIQCHHFIVSVILIDFNFCLCHSSYNMTLLHLETAEQTANQGFWGGKMLRLMSEGKQGFSERETIRVVATS